MEELQKLKNRLFQGQSEQNEVFGLIAVMEICGGYEQLLNLPLDAVRVIHKYLEYQAKQINKVKKK